MEFDALEKSVIKLQVRAFTNRNIVMDTSIQRLLKMKNFIFQKNACTLIEKQSTQD